MSAVGTTLLHNPGWNEGESPILKPWVYTDKSRLSSVGAALTASIWFVALHLLGKCRP